MFACFAYMPNLTWVRVDFRHFRTCCEGRGGGSIFVISGHVLTSGVVSLGSGLDIMFACFVCMPNFTYKMDQSVSPTRLMGKCTIGGHVSVG